MSRRLVSKAKYSSVTIVGLTLIATIVCNVPCFYKCDRMSHDTHDAIEKNVNAPMFIRIITAAFSICIPLMFDCAVDSRAAYKITPFAFSQWSLLLSIWVPCGVLVIVDALNSSIHMRVYLSMLYSLDIMFIGALLSFHSLYATEKIVKKGCLLINSIHAAGIIVLSYRNPGWVSSTAYFIGDLIRFLGIAGMVLLLFKECWVIHVNSNDVYTTLTKLNAKQTRYVNVLFWNLAARLIIYMVTDNGPGSSGTNASYYLMINTLSVLALSLQHSREIKADYSNTVVRILYV